MVKKSSRPLVLPSTYQPAVIPPEAVTSPALWFIFQGAQLLIKMRGVRAYVPQVISPAEFGIEPIKTLYMGQIEGQHIFASHVADGINAPEGMAFSGLRDLFTTMKDTHVGIAGRAVQLIDWERDHQFCGRCGTPTETKAHEYVKACPNCKLTAYPRLSPAVIMLITREDEVLLARNHRYPPNYYSILAGFVEPGESLEEAVAREVMEEVNVSITNIRYFGSQPWPFPNSLMLGFIAEYVDGEIVVQDDELDKAAFFRYDALPSVPPPASIARQLIDWFVESRGGDVSAIPEWTAK